MNKINEQFMLKKLNILYPMNKIIIKHLFCLNKTIYLYFVIKERREFFYILEESILLEIKLDYMKDGIRYMKENKYGVKELIIVQDTKENIYLKMNDSNLLFKDCLDTYMHKMFYDIYKIVY